MRKFHFPLLGVLALASLASCHKDKDDVAFPSDATYTGMNRIEITYNGTAVAGKSADFKALGDGKAQVRYYSKVDFSQLGDAFKEIPEIDGPGVLPGNPIYELSAPFSSDGKNFTASGSGDTDFVTFKYDVAVNADKLTTNFVDVALKDQRMAGLQGKPMAAPSDPLSDDQPFHIVWKTSTPIQLPGVEYGIQDLLRVLVNVPCIPVYNNTASMSLSQVVANGVRSIALDKDGTMPVTYLKTANGASIFTLAPKCMLQYVPLSDTSIRLFINPTDVLSLILLNNDKHDPDIPENPFGAPSRADGTLADLISGLAQNLVPLMARGLPAACVKSDGKFAIYLPSEVAVPMLKQYIIPIMANPVTRGIVQDLVQNNPKLSQYTLAIMALYDSLPLILDQTTDIELGLNFENA